MNPETKIQRLIMMALSDSGCTVWRNETGQFWTGRIVHKDPGGNVTLGNARPIPCGLCVGSADLIGITDDGRFLAVEVKTATGRISKEQKTFIDHVNLMGGVAGVARSVEDALEIIKRGIK